MRSSHSLDRLDAAFDGTRLVADAGLLLPATLAHAARPQAVGRAVPLPRASRPARPTVGDKVLTLVMSALAGGTASTTRLALRAAARAVLGFSVKAPSTLGTFLRSFRWGHVRQLDRVSRELARPRVGGSAGPGAAPFTIDLDSTICETYGLAKEGADPPRVHPRPRLPSAARRRGRHRRRAHGEPARGRAATVRGAAHFLRETIGRVRAAGATGELTMRADSGFYAHAVVAVCRQMDVRFSITAAASTAALRA